jgi:hypothetical protein
MRTFRQIKRDIREAEGIVNAPNLPDIYDKDGNLDMTASQRRVAYLHRLARLQNELDNLRRVFPNQELEVTYDDE